MIEIPEGATLARQIREILTGKTITEVFNATHPHKFTWYLGDPAHYGALLVGKKVCSSQGHGAFVDILLDEETYISVSDGVNLRYYASGSDIPTKYQLLITFEDDSFMVFTVAMYGGIIAFQKTFDNPYYQGALTKPSPLDGEFDAAYFSHLISGAKPNLSAKAFLATQQRIPGLGNGVLQDILFRAKIHPKRKLSTMGDKEFALIFTTLKVTLQEMTERGGRNTETDLLGHKGGYRVALSKNTYLDPCPDCAGAIVKEAYLGGAVYYCPRCQPLQ